MATKGVLQPTKTETIREIIIPSNKRFLIYVAFSKDGEENDPIDYREIADYKSIYSDYNSKIMYNTLSDGEKQLYRIFEYALDKEYTSLFVDSRLLAESEMSLQEILDVLSMDSPLVQQSYSYTTDETGYQFSYLGKLLNFNIEGEIFTIDNFSHEAMEKKKSAIAVAQEVFNKMPKNLSQTEQARYFYRFLTREVQYYDNGEEPAYQHNLYDAFIMRQTQCDGFSNAFSLLCSMAKIPCAEKLTTPENDDGHTWNIFCADGVWYNADLAISEDFAKLHRDMNVDFNFGLADSRMNYTPDLAERFPKCTTNLLKPDLMLKSNQDTNMLIGIKKAFKENGRHFVYVGVERGEMRDSDFQKIANHLDSDIEYLEDEFDGKNYYYIFKD